MKSIKEKLIEIRKHHINAQIKKSKTKQLNSEKYLLLNQFRLE